jgi:UDP-N-acetylglucosamine--N-acetylmuramyl-(pentapeptide) pyrophosphoryl-undecaprenol N-acetylglucosamine transferase
MAEVYAKADLLVSRAGATTLAELSVLGKPAVLIPYPYAADNHQEKNAEFYVQGGGALMLREKELTAQKLAETLTDLVGNRERLMEMGALMRSKAFPNAAENIVDECLNCIAGKSGN